MPGSAVSLVVSTSMCTEKVFVCENVSDKQDLTMFFYLRVFLQFMMHC